MVVGIMTAVFAVEEGTLGGVVTKARSVYTMLSLGLFINED